VAEADALAYWPGRIARAVKWGWLAAITPMAIFPFLWALAAWTVLSLARRGADAARILRRGAAGELRITDDEIVLHGTRRLRRSRVVAGWIEPDGSPGADTLVLTLAGGDRVLARLPRADARAVLEELGIGVRRQVLRFPLSSRAAQAGQGAVFHLLGPFLLLLVSLAPISLFLAGILGLRGGYPEAVTTLWIGGALLALVTYGSLWLLRYVSPGAAAVGADGVAIEYPGRRRFVPHSAITNVTLSNRGVRIHSGMHVVDLPTYTFVSREAAQSAALAARIQEARDAALSRADAAHAKLALLDREGRSLVAWRDELRKVLRDGAGYREARFDAEELASIVEDVGASAERRVAAAIAISPRAKDPILADRLRIAVGVCANEPLRIAIDRALEGGLEDEELARAVEAGYQQKMLLP